MKTRYNLRFTRHTSTSTANYLMDVGDFVELRYSKHVRNMTTCTVTLRADHPLLDVIQIEDVMVIDRISTDETTAGFFRRRDTGFVLRDKVRVVDGEGRTYVQLLLASPHHYLSRHIVAYAKQESGETSWTSTALTSIFSTLTTHNAGPLTQAGRLIAHVGLSIAIDTTNAPSDTIDFDSGLENLWTALQRLLDIGTADVHFDLNASAGAMTVTLAEDYFGDDLSARVFFSIPAGSAVSGNRRDNTFNEPQAVVVGGSGEGPSRTFVVRTGNGWASGDDPPEAFVDARDISATASLNAIGDAYLEQHRAKASQDIEIVNTLDMVYLRDYDLGDRVSILVGSDDADDAVTQKIAGVSVAVDAENTETLALEFVNV